MEDMRNQMLNELIDKMHSRLADKAYPDEKPPVEEEVKEVMQAEPAKEDEPATDDSEELSDADIDDILKSC